MADVTAPSPSANARPDPQARVCAAPGCHAGPVGGSRHCAPCAARFKRPYTRYKKYQARIQPRLKPDPNLPLADLLSGYAAVERLFDMRTAYRKAAFTPATWDQGHSTYLAGLLSILREYETLLQQAYARQSELVPNEEASTDSADSDADALNTLPGGDEASEGAASVDVIVGALRASPDPPLAVARRLAARSASEKVWTVEIPACIKENEELHQRLRAQIVEIDGALPHPAATAEGRLRFLNYAIHCAVICVLVAQAGKKECNFCIRESKYDADDLARIFARKPSLPTDVAKGIEENPNNIRAWAQVWLRIETRVWHLFGITSGGPHRVVEDLRLPTPRYGHRPGSILGGAFPTARVIFGNGVRQSVEAQLARNSIPVD